MRAQLLRAGISLTRVSKSHGNLQTQSFGDEQQKGEHTYKSSQEVLLFSAVQLNHWIDQYMKENVPEFVASADVKVAFEQISRQFLKKSCVAEFAPLRIEPSTMAEGLARWLWACTGLDGGPLKNAFHLSDNPFCFYFGRVKRHGQFDPPYEGTHDKGGTGP